MSFEVCCLGHMCTDILVKDVDSYPKTGQLLPVESITQKTGGCAMNAAIGLAKLGVRTALIGKVGDDGFGRFIRKTLEDSGVNTEGLTVDPDSSTSGTIVLTRSDGERSFLHCYGTNATLCAADVDLEIVKNSRILFIGGTFLTPRFDGKDAAAILSEARKAGVLTAMDTAWDASGKWLETIESSLPLLDWFMPSIEEAEQMFGTRDEVRLAKIMKERGVKNVAVKMGSEGCYLEPENGKGTWHPVFPVEAVDTTGAGDAWCAGFLSALIRGLPPADAAVWGNAVGALCITQIGTTAGLRDREQTEAFIKEH